MLHAGEDDWGVSDDFRRDVMRVLGDVGTIEALKRIKAAFALKENMNNLHSRGAVILLPTGDELSLTPEAIDAHLSNEAERAGLAADEAYYGGDSPGSYGPSDPKGR